MDITLIICTIIGGIFGLFSIILLQRAWVQKLMLTNQMQFKIAKLKTPKINTPKRMPKGYMEQLGQFAELLGNENVQAILSSLTGRDAEIPEGNKLIEAFIPIAQGFLEGMSQGQQEHDQLPAQKSLYS